MMVACPKCGNYAHDIKYVAAGSYPQHYLPKVYYHNESLQFVQPLRYSTYENTGYRVVKEHLAVLCKTCGYGSAKDTLDNIKK